VAKPTHWANPIATRSLTVLEIVSELVTNTNSFWQVKVAVREQGAPEWDFTLYASSMIDGIREVVNRESAFAIVNPSTTLALAYRGVHPFESPQPVRTLAVLPTHDQFVFAVRPETGLRTFEDIAKSRLPLRIGVRSIPEHSVHIMLDHVMDAAGFSMAEMLEWGAVVKYEGGLPYPDSQKFSDFVDGSLDAVFDEASDYWVNEALAAGMTILPVEEATMQRLEARGFRRGYLRKETFSGLASDVLTIDFSGWPMFVHAEAPDTLVRQICAALDARKGAIPWQGTGPLPLARMCNEHPDTPQDVPMHPAAERFWRERGYITNAV